MKKKLMPESVEYWIDKGYSIEESEIKSKEMSGVRYPGNPKYYLFRNITDDLEKATELSNNWKKEKCQFTRENKIKNKFGGDVDAYETWNKTECKLSKNYLVNKLGSEEEYLKYKQELGYKLIDNGPVYKKYWIRKGYSEEESKLKVIEHSRRSSRRCVEYWLERGYDLEQSIIEVSKYQNNTSIEKFIEKYGTDEGSLKYNLWKYGQKLKSIRSYQQWVSKGYSEEESKKIVSNIQSEYAKLQPKRLEYWIKRGYSEEESKILSYHFARSLCTWCIEYWLDKGYSESDAKSKISEIQRENSLKGLKSFKRNSYIPKSKLELSVISYLSNKGCNLLVDKFYEDTENRKIYFPDIVLDNKCIIEIYGDYWHGNPDMFDENQVILGGITAGEKWKTDKIRIENLKKCSNLPILIWWEKDIIETGLEKLFLEIFE